MMTSLSALLIEDSPTDAKLVVRELGRVGRAVEFERVETAETMRAALERAAWDIVISDWSMPRFTAPAALALLHELGLDLPFLIVSGTIGEETAVSAMRAGAHDFLLKDRLERLSAVVERELREREVRVARRRAEEALRDSEARLRAALHARDDFLSVASHELKTPLTSLRFEIESAQKLVEAPPIANVTSKLQGKLLRASLQVTRLASLIDNFLDVTQLAAGRWPRPGATPTPRAPRRRRW